MSQHSEHRNLLKILHQFKNIFQTLSRVKMLWKLNNMHSAQSMDRIHRSYIHNSPILTISNEMFSKLGVIFFLVVIKFYL